MDQTNNQNNHCQLDMLILHVLDKTLSECYAKQNWFTNKMKTVAVFSFV